MVNLVGREGNGGGGAGGGGGGSKPSPCRILLSRFPYLYLPIPALVPLAPVLCK